MPNIINIRISETVRDRDIQRNTNRNLYTLPTLECNFEWPWVTLSELAKYSTTWSIARYSWASWFFYLMHNGSIHAHDALYYWCSTKRWEAGVLCAVWGMVQLPWPTQCYVGAVAALVFSGLILRKQEVKVIWQNALHGGPIPRLGVIPGGRKLNHWIPGVGFPISVP